LRKGYADTRIVTERLVMRPLRIEDVDVFFEMYADPDVMRYMGGPYTGTLDELRKRMSARIEEHFRSDAGLFATELRATGELIGRCGQLRWNVEGTLETEVGYLIARPYWGRGLATEAAKALIEDGFTRLGETRLISLIHPENVASQRVAAHNGLRYEGDVNAEGLTVQPVRMYSIERTQP
jgi:ribosomal-protein-alanine N-acetyltransferase